MLGTLQTLTGYGEMSVKLAVNIVMEKCLVWVCFPRRYLRDTVGLCGFHRICLHALCLCKVIFLLVIAIDQLKNCTFSLI